MKLERDLKLENYFQRVNEDERIPRGYYYIVFQGYCDYPQFDDKNDWYTSASFKDCKLVKDFIEDVHKIIKTEKDPDAQYTSITELIDKLIGKYCEQYRQEEDTYSSFGLECEDEYKFPEEKQYVNLQYPLSMDVAYCDVDGRLFNVTFE